MPNQGMGTDHFDGTIYQMMGAENPHGMPSRIREDSHSLIASHSECLAEEHDAQAQYRQHAEQLHHIVAHISIHRGITLNGKHAEKRISQQGKCQTTHGVRSLQQSYFPQLMPRGKKYNKSKCRIQVQRQVNIFR